MTFFFVSWSNMISYLTLLLLYKLTQKRSFDPVDYKTIYKIEFWVVDENLKPEHDYDKLETILEDELQRDKDYLNINQVNSEFYVNNIKN